MVVSPLIVSILVLDVLYTFILLFYKPFPHSSLVSLSAFVIPIFMVFSNLHCGLSVFLYHPNFNA